MKLRLCKNIHIIYMIENPSAIFLFIGKNNYELKTLPEPFSGYDFFNCIELVENKIKSYLDIEDIESAIQCLMGNTKLRFGNLDSFKKDMMEIDLIYGITGVLNT